MPFKKKYYHLEEKNTQEISVLWKGAQFTICICICLFGFMTACGLRWMLECFNNKCILNSHVVFEITSTNGNESLPPNLNQFPELVNDDLNKSVNNNESSSENVKIIDLTNTLWGRPSYCQFCQLTTTMSAIVAIAAGAFILIQSRGGAGYPSDVIPGPWKFMYPFLILCTIQSIIILVGANQITNGARKFCSQLSHHISCSPIIDEYTLQFHETKKPFYVYYEMTTSGAYLSFGCWIIQIILIVIRVLCVVDFQLYIIEIKEKVNSNPNRVKYKDEDEIKITNV